MNAMPFLLIAAVAYLLGSIPWGYLLVRAFRNEIFAQQGAATSARRTWSARAPRGLARSTFLLDAAKGWAAVVFATGVLPMLPARWVQHDAAYTFHVAAAASLAALCALLGHIYPVWLGFRGGKGGRDRLWSHPGAYLARVAAFARRLLLTLALFRIVSLASILAAIAIPIAAPRAAAAHWPGLGKAHGAGCHSGHRHPEASRQCPPPAGRHGVSLRQQRSNARMSRSARACRCVGCRVLGYGAGA